MTLIFGKDHPAGKWSERHNIPATEIAAKQDHEAHYSSDKPVNDKNNSDKERKDNVTVRVVDVSEEQELVQSTVDIAVNESLTWEAALRIVISPLTWLPALAYLTTFGLEIALDAKMADVLYGLFNNRINGFDQELAGYYTSVL